MNKISTTNIPEDYSKHKDELIRYVLNKFKSLEEYKEYEYQPSPCGCLGPDLQAGFTFCSCNLCMKIFSYKSYLIEDVKDLEFLRGTLKQKGYQLSLQATQTFRHIEKGTLYTLMTVTNLTATDSKFAPAVVYKDNKTFEIWSRPLEEFLNKFEPSDLNFLW